MNIIFFNGWGFSSYHEPSCFLPDYRIEAHYAPDQVFSENKDFFLAAENKKFLAQSERYLVVGWSLGGMLAIEFLLKETEICNNCELVLLSSSSNFTMQEADRIKSLKTLIRRVKRMSGSSPLTALKSFYQDLTDEYHRYKVSGPDSDELLEYTKYLSPEGLLKALYYLENTDLRESVAGLSIPVHIIHGSDDMLIPQAHAEELHSLIPESELTIIPHAGHMIPFTHNKKISSLIKNMLP